MPITIEEAFAATDPNQPDDVRQAAAQHIMAGVAANDAYINSRDPLEQLILRARGPQVVAHEDLDQSHGGSEQIETGEPAVEGTAEEEPPAVTGGAAPGPVEQDPTAQEIAVLEERLAALRQGRS